MMKKFRELILDVDKTRGSARAKREWDKKFDYLLQADFDRRVKNKKLITFRQFMRKVKRSEKY